MSKAEVIEYLKKKEEATTKEIADEIGVNLRTARKNLNRLRREFEVIRRNLTREEVAEMDKQFQGRRFVWSLRTERRLKKWIKK